MQDPLGKASRLAPTIEVGETSALVVEPGSDLGQKILSAFPDGIPEIKGPQAEELAGYVLVAVQAPVSKAARESTLKEELGWTHSPDVEDPSLYRYFEGPTCLQHATWSLGKIEGRLPAGFDSAFIQGDGGSRIEAQCTEGRFRFLPGNAGRDYLPTPASNPPPSGDGHYTVVFESSDQAIALAAPVKSNEGGNGNSIPPAGTRTTFADMTMHFALVPKDQLQGTDPWSP